MAYFNMNYRTLFSAADPETRQPSMGKKFLNKTSRFVSNSFAHSKTAEVFSRMARLDSAEEAEDASDDEGYSDTGNVLEDDYEDGEQFAMGTSEYLRSQYFSPVFRGLKPEDVVVVTGGSGGLGRALCEEFVKKKVARVICLDIKVPEESSNNPQLAKIEGVEYFKCDVSDIGQVREVALQIAAGPTRSATNNTSDNDGPLPQGRGLPERGSVTVLINNAGVMFSRPLLELSDQDFAKTLGVNLVACFNTIKTFLPGMIDGQRGFIVTIASVLGHLSPAQLSAYGASKAGLIAMHEALTAEIDNMICAKPVEGLSLPIPDDSNSAMNTLRYYLGHAVIPHPRSIFQMRAHVYGAAKKGGRYATAVAATLRAKARGTALAQTLVDLRQGFRRRPPRQLFLKTLLVCPGQIETQMFEDVTTPSRILAPVLKPSAVARVVVKRVSKGRGGAVYMPFYARFIPLLKAFPVDVVKTARWLSGVDQAVSHDEPQHRQRQDEQSAAHEEETEL